MTFQNVKKKIMITGATGFVGSNFIKSYETQYEIVPVSLRETAVEDIDFSGVNVVLHLAALAHQSSIVPFQRYYEVNTTLTEKLACRSKAAGVKQFVFYSTVKVYGVDGILDDKNFVLNEKTPIKPTDSYGKSKAMAEEILQKLEDEKFKVAIIRPPMIYGEGVKGNMASLIRLVDKIPILPFAYEANENCSQY
ncbi:MAG: NAD-dependent epimerase/dehydratase family protein [Bdellovibrionaceae bacterium]|nr:NAD-dependent epimerase/dehydratase family protein [Pseudobdellovibrionaceae bacterium]